MIKPLVSAVVKVPHSATKYKLWVWAPGQGSRLKNGGLRIRRGKALRMSQFMLSLC